MALYAGETVLLKTTVRDPDSYLTDTDVTSTAVTIVDSAGVVVQAPSPMTWDAEDQSWQFSWQTASAGNFTARLRLIGPTFDTWEYVKVTVKS